MSIDSSMSYDGLAYHAKKNRQTGTEVALWDGKAALLDMDAGRWIAECCTHNQQMNADTKAEALYMTKNPLEHCEVCVWKIGGGSRPEYRHNEDF